MLLPMGLAMIALSGILTILAAWHCHVVYQPVERDEVLANRGLMVAVIAAFASLLVSMKVSMQLTAQNY